MSQETLIHIGVGFVAFIVAGWLLEPIWVALTPAGRRSDQ